MMGSFSANFIWMLSGLWTTVQLTAIAVVSGLILALLLTLLKTLAARAFGWLVDAYIFFIRGTPVLVQIFLIYYGLGQFAAMRDSVLWPLLREPFFCSVLAIALNTAAYTTVMLLGAIKSIPRGEFEASYALALTRMQAMRYIIIPHALRLVLPAYSNEVIMVLKVTALASTITVLDLMGVTQQIIAANYENITYLAIAGAMYLLLNSLIVKLFRWLERRKPALA